MHSVILVIVALLLIPAGLAGITGGLEQLLTDGRSFSEHWGAVILAAEPLWTACQSLLCMMLGAGLLLVSAALLAHGLKSRA